MYLHFYFSGDIMKKKFLLFIFFVILLIALNYYGCLNDFVATFIIYFLTILEFISGIFLVFSVRPAIHNKILLFYKKISFIDNDYKKAFAKNFESARKLFGRERILNAIFIFGITIDLLLRLLPPNLLLPETKSALSLSVKLLALIFYICAFRYISAKIKKLSSGKISDDSPWKL